MISSFTSCSSMLLAFFQKKMLQVFGEAARGQDLAHAGVPEALDADVVQHLDAKAGWARRHVPPLVALAERGRRAG